jgi:hypothetical protein
LYNSIKHGLSTVALDEATQIARREGSETVIGHKGPMFAYMHRWRQPGANRDVGEWFVSMKGASTERDLGLAILMARAVESLWDVASRRYTGKSGWIRHIKKSVVELVIYGLLMDSLNVVNTMTLEMPRLKDDGSYDSPRHSFVPNHVPEGYQKVDGVHSTDSPRIHLPTRQRDQRVFSTAQRAFYPFSPSGSQRG